MVPDPINDQLPQRLAEPNSAHVLFIGIALSATSNSLAQAGMFVCEHADNPVDAIDMISARSQGRCFDCVMIDMRHREDGGALNVVAIAALQPRSPVIVLCQTEQVELYRSLTGVGSVLPATVSASGILDVISQVAEKPNVPHSVPAARNPGPCTGSIDSGEVIERDRTFPLPVVDETPINLEELAKFSASEAKKLLACQPAETSALHSPAFDGAAASAAHPEGSTIRALFECSSAQRAHTN